ncbi:MAG: HAD family phosphatase [Oscillospiraceae bacterium]|nr:HAD family phosphatase [Oscillospiraceae bacterium]
MIKNIVFDMGNVLIRFDRDVFMDRLGVAEEDKPLLAREIFQSLEWARMDRGSLTDEEAAAIICARIPARLHDAVRKLVSFWDRPILEVDGVYDLVEELKGLGYRIYLLSNASLRQHDYWPRIPASRFFDGTLVSADVKLVKPQPEIYRLLCSTFELDPAECFFIDDAIQNVEGAFYCGMPGAVFHNDISELRKKLISAGVPVRV